MPGPPWVSESAGGDHLQVGDKAHQQVVKNDRGHAGNGDPPEALPGVRPVDLRRLVVGPGNVLQSGQKDDDQVSAEPYGDQRQGRRDHGARVQEFHRYAAAQLNQVVEQPVIIIKEPFPAEINSQHRQHVGKVEDRAEKTARGHLPVQQHGDDHGVDNTADDGEACVFQRRQQGPVEFRVPGKQADIVVQAEVFHLPEAVPAEQAQGKGSDHRDIGDTDQADHRRQQADPCRPGLLGYSGSSFSAARSFPDPFLCPVITCKPGERRHVPPAHAYRIVSQPRSEGFRPEGFGAGLQSSAPRRSEGGYQPRQGGYQPRQVVISLVAVTSLVSRVRVAISLVVVISLVAVTSLVSRVKVVTSPVVVISLVAVTSLVSKAKVAISPVVVTNSVEAIIPMAAIINLIREANLMGQLLIRNNVRILPTTIRMQSIA